MRQDIEPNPEDFHIKHEVSKEIFIGMGLWPVAFGLPPMDWEITVLNRLFLYNKDMFVFFQRYTNHECRIREIYQRNPIRFIEEKMLFTCVHIGVYMSVQLKLLRYSALRFDWHKPHKYWILMLVLADHFPNNTKRIQSIFYRLFSIIYPYFRCHSIGT